MENQNQHFVIVTYPAQGHINPGRHLARKIAISTGARVTISTAISAHRKMFNTDEECHDGLIYYCPHSDGYDEGFKKDVDDQNHYMTKSKQVGSETLSALMDKFSHEGCPVTGVIYALLMTWVADVAKTRDLPSALYWIQPATVFAIYYHYFHGYRDMIVSKASDPTSVITLPHLPPLKIKDIPSFLAITNKDDPYYVILDYFMDIFATLEKGLAVGEKPKILVNSLDELEFDAIKSVEEMVDLISIGPVLSSQVQGGIKSTDLFKTDQNTYFQWLQTKPEKSVVYISFGSMSLINKNQMEEISRALKETGVSYLWVVRKDNREELGSALEDLVSNTDGMIIEWSNQFEVLSHPSIACFVTHCGWNSTLETLACGVPAIGVPQWTDQGTNAMLIEKWGIGVRGQTNGERIIEGDELKRCLEIVMGEGERGEKIREMAQFWKERVKAAVDDGGSSERNLRAFVEEISG